MPHREYRSGGQELLRDVGVAVLNPSPLELRGEMSKAGSIDLYCDVHVLCRSRSAAHVDCLSAEHVPAKTLRIENLSQRSKSVTERRHWEPGRAASACVGASGGRVAAFRHRANPAGSCVPLRRVRSRSEPVVRRLQLLARRVRDDRELPSRELRTNEGRRGRCAAMRHQASSLCRNSHVGCPPARLSRRVRSPRRGRSRCCPLHTR